LFNISIGEFIIILLVAFIIVGPSDLPKVARGLGKAVRYIKNLWGQMLNAADLESEVKDINNIKKQAESTAQSINPNELLGPIKKEVKGLEKTINTGSKEISENLKKLKS